MRVTGDVLKNTAIVAGKATVVTGKIAMGAVKTTGKAVRMAANIIGGRTEVTLLKRGNALLVNSVLNRRAGGLFILDTGSSTTQISSQMARRLGIDIGRGKKIQCSVADGRLVDGVVVNVKEMRVGSANVYNMPAVVLLGQTGPEVDGLLGMSFLNNFIFKIDSEKGLLTLQKRITS